VGGGTPDGLVVEFEEVQRAIHRWTPPPFHPVGAGLREFGERRPQDAIDLAGERFDVGSMVEHRHDRHDVAAADDRVEMCEFTDDGRDVGVEPDLLVRLPQGGVDRRLARVEPPAGKADLPAVVTHVHRSPGEQHLGSVGPVDQCDQHGRHTSVGERRQQRGPVLRHPVEQLVDRPAGAARPRRRMVLGPDVGAGNALVPAAPSFGHP
jgi:hypothetical protein